MVCYFWLHVDDLHPAVHHEAQSEIIGVHWRVSLMVKNVYISSPDISSPPCLLIQYVLFCSVLLLDGTRLVFVYVNEQICGLGGRKVIHSSRCRILLVIVCCPLEGEYFCSR